MHLMVTCEYALETHACVADDWNRDRLVEMTLLRCVQAVTRVSTQWVVHGHMLLMLSLVLKMVMLNKGSSTCRGMEKVVGKSVVQHMVLHSEIRNKHTQVSAWWGFRQCLHGSNIKSLGNTWIGIQETHHMMVPLHPFLVCLGCGGFANLPLVSLKLGTKC